MDTLKIVFADDDKITRKHLKKLLAHENYEILIAENGLEAWNILRQSGARIIITDWVMPELNGLELCQRIRENYVDTYIYIILITSRGDKDDAIEGLAAGADDFIVKPLDIAELKARIRSGERIIKLEDEYKATCSRLHQSEKMMSLGLLAAGVAHEINNPTGFVISNLQILAEYLINIRALIDKQKTIIDDVKKNSDWIPGHIIESVNDLESFEYDMDMESVINDVEVLVRESQDGLDRVKKIVHDLKDFSHPGELKMRKTDINALMDSTLNMIWNAVKYKAFVKKNYGAVPMIPCYPQQLSQVFMNIVINAAQAIDDMGEIDITTEYDETEARIKIRDNGSGIEQSHQSRIFEPFFTTKEVGKGTGLGLNVAYNIIAKHNGEITLVSEIGKGTEFTIHLPLS